MVHEKDTQISFLVKAGKAMFTDPLNRISAEKISYPVPTYSALQGLMRHIYSSPCIVWVIDSVRVLKPIRYIGYAISDPYRNKKGDRATYQYLLNPEYIITAHYVFDYSRPELSDGWTYAWHDRMIKKAMEQGGRFNLCLGCSECPALIYDMSEEMMAGYYDDEGRRDLGLMFHSYREASKNDPYRYAYYDQYIMENGCIWYNSQRECQICRRLFKEQVYELQGFDLRLYGKEEKSYELKHRIVHDSKKPSQ